MSFNSFFSMFGNNSNGGLHIFRNQPAEKMQRIPAEEYAPAPEASEEAAFDSGAVSIETEAPVSLTEETAGFDADLQAFQNETSEKETIENEPFEPLQAASGQFSVNSDNSVSLDESDPDQLLELDDLFAFD